MSLEEKLKDILEKSKPWERVKTNIEGAFIIKIPSSKSKPATLAVEINPLEERNY